MLQMFYNYRVVILYNMCHYLYQTSSQSKYKYNQMDLNLQSQNKEMSSSYPYLLAYYKEHMLVHPKLHLHHHS